MTSSMEPYAMNHWPEALTRVYSDIYDEKCQACYCCIPFITLDTFFEQFKCQPHDQYLYFLLKYIRTDNVSLSKRQYDVLTDHLIDAIQLENVKKFRWNYDALWCCINILYYHDKCIPKPYNN